MPKSESLKACPKCGASWFGILVKGTIGSGWIGGECSLAGHCETCNQDYQVEIRVVRITVKK